MMDQQVVVVTEVDETTEIDRHGLEAAVGRFDEDLRLVPRRAQHPLDREHLVTDGIAVAERREYLLDADHSFASTSLAGGTSRRRRSNQPGSGSMSRGGLLGTACRMSGQMRSSTVQL